MKALRWKGNDSKGGSHLFNQSIISDLKDHGELGTESIGLRKGLDFGKSLVGRYFSKLLNTK